MITTLSGWLKVGVFVDEVVVAIYFTDTHEVFLHDTFKALTTEERAEVRAELKRRFGADLGDVGNEA